MRIKKAEKLTILLAIMKMAEITEKGERPGCFTIGDILVDANVQSNKVHSYIFALAESGPILKTHARMWENEYSIASLFLLACEIDCVTSPRPAWAKGRKLADILQDEVK